MALNLPLTSKQRRDRVRRAQGLQVRYLYWGSTPNPGALSIIVAEPRYIPLLLRTCNPSKRHRKEPAGSGMRDLIPEGPWNGVRKGSLGSG